jgi:lipopolysaccharide transport system permease protein
MSRNTQFIIHSSASQLRNPKLLFRQMGRDLLAARGLAWQLLVRDIKAQYRQSFLGFVWAFLPPIVTAAGLTFASNSKVINIGETDFAYPAYVMFSTALWQTFAEALSSPVQGVTQAKGMLAKINFPREAIILAKVGQVFFNFGVKLILIIGLFIWFQVPVSLSVILAPVALIHLIIFGTAVGTFIAPLGALYQDFMKGLTLLIGAWIFITPVLYPSPTGDGIFSTIVKLNPVTPLLVTTRELATTGNISDPVGFWIASAVAFVGLLVAWLFYRLAMPFVVERMSS